MKILIIGAGPVGLTCAHLLGRLQIPSLILEKNPTLTTHPSAHFLHSHSLEIFSSINLSSQIYASMPPTHYWRNFIYCSQITQMPYRIHDHFLSPSFFKNSSLSSFSTAHFPQHKLVHLLADTLPKNTELILDQEFESLRHEDKVIVKTKGQREFTADYVIACDGANSHVRESLGIPMKDSGILQSFLNVHFVSKELGEVCKKNPAMIYFIYNPSAVVVIVMHNPDEGEFVMQIPFYPSLMQPEEYDNQQIATLVNSCVGDGANIRDISVKSVKMWKMATRIAYFLRKNNVFLAGDAAHSLIPAGGFGLNTGISDAHNLCWKFKYPELLDTYCQERIPRIQEVIDSCYGNYLKTVKIAASFGLEIDYAKAYQYIAEKLPFGSSIFKYGLKFGQRLLINDKNARKFLADDENMLNLIYPTEDFEYQYKKGFFTKGGELAPNMQVMYKGAEYSLRLLPGVISRDEGRAAFVKVFGSEELPEFKYDSIDVMSPDGFSYIIRPDGIVYWSSKPVT